MKATIQSHQEREVIDITADVQRAIAGTGGKLCTVTVLHTTAAITTAEGSPDTNQDFLSFLDSLVDRQAKWQHAGADHASDHFLASTIGPSVTLPLSDGKLVLGTWQKLVLVELDGPKTRNIEVTVV